MNAQSLSMDLNGVDILRFSTAGSVDDGKSTLIGRLLYDSKAIMEDQYSAIERASEKKGVGEVDLALLTDGLRAEREQGITIDVAYRYFATPRRKFIIADTPGHVQYTRNMVTGASTADLAVVLIDARKGVLTQSRRHAFLSALLQVPHVVVLVNKMDLVEYDKSVFRGIVDEFQDFAAKLSVRDLTFIPASALRGDNIVVRSSRMDWYSGPTVLHHLESVHVDSSRNMVDFRFPVQTVIRPHQDFRGFAGQVASGTVRPGEQVVVLPSGITSSVKSIDHFEGTLDEAIAGDSVVLTLNDEVDVSRGDMIVRKRNLPVGAEELEATLCWMNEEPLNVDKRYVLQHTTRRVGALLSELVYKIDVDTLHREPAESLSLNDIGRVRFNTTERLFFDPYELNRATGSFVLIDPDTNNTVAAGMIWKAVRSVSRITPFPMAEGAAYERKTSSDTMVQSGSVNRSDREHKNGHQAAVVWLTGLSGAGKTTIAHQVEQLLFSRGVHVTCLDGDNLRQGLCGDLGFIPKDRKENVRRFAEIADLFFDAGNVVLCTLISPFRGDRSFARSLIPDGRFFEVFVDADLESCRARDPKGLYKKVDAGEIPSFTGISSPYEAPVDPELHLTTADHSVEECAEHVVSFLEDKGIIAPR